MNKKLLIAAVVALFLGAGVFTATSLAAKEQISDLTLANIEAMTIPGNVEVRLPDNYWFNNQQWNTTDANSGFTGTRWYPLPVTCYDSGAAGTRIDCVTGNGNCFSGTRCKKGSFPNF